MSLRPRQTAYPSVLGVVGGMGPRATADFFVKLIAATPAARDQDHIPVLIYSAPQIPNRTAAILHGGPSPLGELRRAVRTVAQAGASVVVLACNTAHYWFDDLQASVAIPILHIADAAIADLQPFVKRHGRVGLLATSGTIAAQIYQPRLSAIGLITVVPDLRAQEAVDAGIALVKAGSLGDAADAFDLGVRNLVEAKATVIVLACTEIPLVLRRDRHTVAFVDAAAALATSCVQFCLHEQSQ
jgi:aspartate racemase